MLFSDRVSTIEVTWREIASPRFFVENVSSSIETVKKSWSEWAVQDVTVSFVICFYSQDQLTITAKCIMKTVCKL